ncbi:polysaccharide deacetylase family protein [Azorhizobium doebereinerae]|uniref:polysaccharide deacetylase family protein n=1 Tax=Azorhizobium doebereinerae TaxID=281091 RepID=UPI0018DBE620
MTSAITICSSRCPTKWPPDRRGRASFRPGAAISGRKRCSPTVRVGLWRFLEAFDRHERRATFYMCGRAVERLPQSAAEIVTRRHEPACHGWLWRPHADFVDPRDKPEPGARPRLRGGRWPCGTASTHVSIRRGCG